MKIHQLFVLAALALSIPAGAQSASDISRARVLARNLGYSEQDINSAVSNLNGDSSSQTVEQNQQPLYGEKRNGDLPGTVRLEPASRKSKGRKGKNPQLILYPVYPSPYTTMGSGAMPVTNVTDPTQYTFEQYFEDEVEDTGNMIYGHDYFLSDGLSLAPNFVSSVPSSYVLGPGDNVVVDIWGASTSHTETVIGSDGSINLPNWGLAYIAGMTVSKAEATLKSQLSNVYSGLSGDKADTFISISLSKIKAVSVNVTGEVETPGLYSFPSLTSIPSAIFMAGGVSDNGSVRNIALYRRGKKVATFDLYDFLFKGKVNDNLRLQDGDVLSVEAYHNVVKISGAVMRPMRYELKDGETVSNLVYYASGFRTDAQRNAIHVSRLGEESRKGYDLSSEDFGSFRLLDGDEVSVRFFRRVGDNSVSITGPVKYPGNYTVGGEINDLASLIKAAGGLVEGAFTGYCQINRVNEDRRPEFLSFNLEDVLSGESVVALKREDKVVIYSKTDLVTDQSVSISGAVEYPGNYSFYEGMTVADLIEAAGGLSEDAYIARGVISHSGSGKAALAPFNVKDATDGDGKQEVLLQCEDAVHIYKLSELKTKATVAVNGEVNAPGKYPYRPGMTLSDLVELALGYADGVDLRNVELASRGGEERGKVYIMDLVANPEDSDRVLMPYDIVSFHRQAYFREQTTVTVEGEIMSPGTYVVDKAEVRLSDIAARVGGFTDVAYVHGAKLQRKLTKEEYERQMLAVKIANQSLNAENQIDTLLLTDSYFIGIDLEKAINNPGSVSDVVLREGDVLSVPQMNNTVKISGGVFYPNTVAFDSKLDWRGYVHQAGGFTKLARRNKTYAVYMNGKVAVSDKIKPEPGMEIIVPERNAGEDHKLTPVEIASLASSGTSIATMVVSLVRMLL